MIDSSKFLDKNQEIRAINQSPNETYFNVQKSRHRVKLPKQINEELAFLLGAIIGDGSLPRKKQKGQYIICFTNQDSKVCNLFLDSFYKCFNVKMRIYKRRKHNSEWFYLVTGSKIIYKFFEFLGIPSGKKSHIVGTPNIIKESNSKIKLGYLKGLFETDGGWKRDGFYYCTASSQLKDDLNKMFEEFDVTFSNYTQTFKNGTTCYYIRLNKEQFNKLNVEVV